MAAKLKKGDKVFILAGKDKGKEGEIIQIIGSDKAIVQGINLVKKHKKTLSRGWRGHCWPRKTNS